MNDELLPTETRGMSETIGKLIEALSKAQGEIKEAKRDSNNPFFKSSYADLASVWLACREPLSKNGLAVIQTTKRCNGDVSLTTILGHSSGEWISGELIIKPSKPDPQSIGSAITYARRYALAAIVGVAPSDDDDDGEGAMNRKSEKEPQPSEFPPKSYPASELQRKKVFAMSKERGMDEDTFKTFVIEVTGKQSRKDLTSEDIDKLIKAFQQWDEAHKNGNQPQVQ